MRSLKRVRVAKKGMSIEVRGKKHDEQDEEKGGQVMKQKIYKEIILFETRKKGNKRIKEDSS